MPSTAVASSVRCAPSNLPDFRLASVPGARKITARSAESCSERSEVSVVEMYSISTMPWIAMRSARSSMAMLSAEKLTLPVASKIGADGFFSGRGAGAAARSLISIFPPGTGIGSSRTGTRSTIGSVTSGWVPASMRASSARR